MPKGQTRKDIRCYLLLGLFLGIAYLPLSSLRFAVKNDALTENFPPKYFFSAALRSGHLPFWNPYINFGLPVYADPGFAFWHPLTWLFGLIGYQVWLLSVEILVYIGLGGIFMYHLGRFLRHSRLTAFLMGAMFMCCGFFTGNISHTNFLTCAAFLPLVIQTFLQLQESFTPKRLCFATGSLYLLLAGGHPAIPIGTLYFLAILLIGLVLTSNKTGRSLEIKQMFRTNLLLLVAVIGLTAPIWLSWLEIWPYFDRSSPVYQPKFETVGFTLPSWLSFLFPFSTMAQTPVFGTDRSMRDGYISFIGLALLLIALRRKKNRLQIVFLCAAAVMLLLSLGGPFKSLVYSHLPLLRFIRTNGEYRIFALLSFIITLSWPLETLLNTGKPPPLFRRIMTVFAFLATAAIIVSIISIGTTPLLRSAATDKGLVARIKNQLDILPFPEAMLVNAGLLLIFIVAWYLLRRRITIHRLIPGLLLADLILNCWLSLPVTGIQRQSPIAIQHLLETAPPGIPLPALTPLADNDRPGLEKILGRWSYYSKQPGTPVAGDYPVLFQNTAAYFISCWPDSLNHRPFVFLAHAQSPLLLDNFTPTEIALTTTSRLPDTLVLLQNDFPGWRAWLDGRPCALVHPYGAFLGIPLAAGNDASRKNTSHQVLFRFSPPHLALYLMIMLASALLLVLAAARSKRQPARLPGILQIGSLE
jgi:hypothetical protein